MHMRDTTAFFCCMNFFLHVFEAIIEIFSQYIFFAFYGKGIAHKNRLRPVEKISSIDTASRNSNNIAFSI